ncbi:hypothetical protein PGT21_027786 [Puccinia graminis f. sp. tritici]|uniref:Uncharacterized protein n=1 Tax=Puccinia graminis f. sp. tritici TaxID=56615 RepID=A0A5B0PKF5_PUCGR|nr:hypothetical protein PGT21_027786 [Puccinia graminis f. sp. tritici]
MLYLVDSPFIFLWHLKLPRQHLGSSVMPDKTTSSGDTSSDLNNSSSLKVSGIVQLKPQGSDSNYLDWSFVLLLHLQSLNLSYVLDYVKLKEQTAVKLKSVCENLLLSVERDE